MEKDKTTMETEFLKQKKQHEALQKEKSELEDRVSEAEFTASALTQENAKMAEIVRKEKEEIKVERERSSQVSIFQLIFALYCCRNLRRLGYNTSFFTVDLENDELTTGLFI